jgi:hypothetical protein
MVARRFALLLASILLLGATGALAQSTIQGCQNPDGMGCKYFGGIFGGSCDPPRVVVLACPDAPTPTPVPSATPTPTAAPAEPQPAYTIVDFLVPADFPVNPGHVAKTYTQAHTWIDGVMWGNNGVCCMPPVTPEVNGGECIFSIDYRVSPPQYREWWCSFGTSQEFWESGTVQVAHSDMWPVVVAGIYTRRPAAGTPFTGELRRDPIVWGFGTTEVNTTGWSFPWQLGVLLEDVNLYSMVEGILDLNGHRWLYIQYIRVDTGEIGMARLLWPGAYRMPYWTPDSNLNKDPTVPFFSGIAFDQDGSMIATSGWWPSDTNTSCFVYRSRDEGKTWVRTGIKFEAPVGRTLFGCSFAHKSGGGAEQPWRLFCTIGDSNGPTTGNWHAAVILTQGATEPPNLRTKPVLYTPAPTPHGP